MKVVIENIIASCVLEGVRDLKEIKDGLPGSRYQPDVFNGIVYRTQDPRADIFILADGNVRIHGPTSEEKLTGALDILFDTLENNGIEVSFEETLKVENVIASFRTEKDLDAKAIFEEFKDDGIMYDPTELPGFVLNMGRSGIEILIFPEGKVITRGASNIQDAASSLQMVESRLTEAFKG